MKRIATLILLFVSANISAQNTASEDTATKPAITAIGKPDGDKSEMKIGKEGGSFTSSDGKIRLIVPEGAVSKKTTFSIQPTINLMPTGNGKAYDMEPSGINFNKPLQLVYYYTDDDTEGNSPLIMGMAMQDENGKWFALNKTVLDSLAKTLTAAIHHFSAYVNFRKAKIIPASARVKVNGTRRLQIVGAIWDDTDEDVDLLPLVIVEYPEMKWSVNGIPKGNSSIGIISASQSGSAIFQAPAQIPEQNPVAVTVEEQFLTAFLRRYGVLKLVSNILIYDNAYEVKMESRMISGTKDSWGGIRTAWDKGSFIVTLDKKEPEVLNIQNSLESSVDGCTNFTLLNPTTCTGLLHVAGIKQIKVTPANPPGQPYPIVEIWFVPFPVEFSVFKFYCPKPNGNDGIYGATPVMRIGRAFPYNIKFLAKDGEQIIIDNSKESEDGGYLKVWVREINDD